MRSFFLTAFLALALACSATAQTVTVDFSKTGPRPILGAGSLGSAITDPSLLSKAQSAGFRETRLFAHLYKIFSKPGQYCSAPPCWNYIAPAVQRARAAGMTSLITIVATPVVDQPNPNTCSTPQNAAAPPGSKLNDWAHKTAEVVAYMDKNYPGSVVDYEIWNEPDAAAPAGLCITSGEYSSRSIAYQNLFHAAAVAMHNQAKTDGKVVFIGGPAITGRANAQWVTDLLTGVAKNDPDFVSYHHYAANQSQPSFYSVDSPSCTSSTCSLWTRVQSNESSQNYPTGYAYTYSVIAARVAAGAQPNAYRTPIYLTEFNDDWQFIQDNYRNSVPYSALYNAAVIADLTQAHFGYQTTNPLSKVFYFAGQFLGRTVPYFCLFGDIDSRMDCATSSLAPYPQFYLYQMLFSSSYLGLDGTVSAVPATHSLTTTGLLTSAWSSGNRGSVLLVNPTSGSIKAAVDLKSFQTGQISLAGGKFFIGPTGMTIGAVGLTWNKSGDTWTTSVAIPAKSVVGLLAY